MTGVQTCALPISDLGTGGYYAVKCVTEPGTKNQSGQRMAVGQQQDQPSATRRICSLVPRRCLLLKFQPFALGQFHRALRERNDTAVLNRTVR